MILSPRKNSLTSLFKEVRVMGKTGTIWQFFVLCFLALGGHCLQMLCLPGFGTHANAQNLPHFRAFLLISRSTLPRNAYFSWQTRNCQSVPVLPSYTPPPPNQQGDGSTLEFQLEGPQTELRTLSQNSEQTLQKLRTNRIMNKRAFPK